LLKIPNLAHLSILRSSNEHEISYYLTSIRIKYGQYAIYVYLQSLYSEKAGNIWSKFYLTTLLYSKLQWTHLSSDSIRSTWVSRGEIFEQSRNRNFSCLTPYFYRDSDGICIFNWLTMINFDLSKTVCEISKLFADLQVFQFLNGNRFITWQTANTSDRSWLLFWPQRTSRWIQILSSCWLYSTIVPHYILFWIPT
jgi:hypothetical protein